MIIVYISLKWSQALIMISNSKNSEVSRKTHIHETQPSKVNE